MSTPSRDIIDLTDDSAQLRASFPAPTASSSQPNLQSAHDIIDLDDLESNQVTVDRSPVETPDIEVLEVRSVRSQQPVQQEPSRSRRIERPRSSQPPNVGPLEPVLSGRWGMSRGQAQRGSDSQRHRHRHISNTANHILQTMTDPNRQEELLRDIILPGELDFVSQAFPLGDAIAAARQPPPPTYDAPSPPRKGFTRTPKTDDVLTAEKQKKENTFVRNMNSNRPQPPPLTRGELAKEYLSAYNAISALMWLSIFARVLLLLPLTGPASVYDGAGDFTKWTQTAAVLEIVHSAL
ncbi:MAG: hypothetical protein Q9167_006822, partial [Letrouitia subvulpina]